MKLSPITPRYLHRPTHRTSLAVLVSTPDWSRCVIFLEDRATPVCLENKEATVSCTEYSDSSRRSDRIPAQRRTSADIGCLSRKTTGRSYSVPRCAALMLATGPRRSYGDVALLTRRMDIQIGERRDMDGRVGASATLHHGVGPPDRIDNDDPHIGTSLVRLHFATIHIARQEFSLSPLGMRAQRSEDGERRSAAPIRRAALTYCPSTDRRS